MSHNGSKTTNKMIIFLSILCVIFWTLGAILCSLITGWNASKVTDLLKIIAWPIFIFTEK